MKKQLLFVVALIATFLSYGQTDELNLQKYWKFRNDFVQKYVKVGPQNGESLPVGVRQPLDCQDNVSGTYQHKGTLSWGDGGVRQGHYLALLATEYALRKKYNLDLEGIRNELYFALHAIERLDKFAEVSLEQLYGMGGFYPTEDLNGFFLRDDVPENFHLNWQNDAMDPKCTNASFYKNNNVGQVHDPANGLITENTTYQNVPSIDQIAYLFQGLTLVWKLVDNDVVTPPGMTQSKDLKQWAVDITQRILNYCYEHNWQIIDVNGWPVTNGGGELFYTAYPLSLTAARMINTPFPQIPYPTQFNRKKYVRPSKYQHCITGYGITGGPDEQQQACTNLFVSNGFSMSVYTNLSNGYPAGSSNWQDNSYVQSYQYFNTTTFSITDPALVSFWHNLIPDDVPVVYQDWYDDNDFDFLPNPLSKIKFSLDGNYEVTMHILFNLAVSSGLLSSDNAKTWADVTGNRYLELSNAVINDLTPMMSKSEYQAFLNSIDFSGPFSLSVSDQYGIDSYEQGGDWTHQFRWTKSIEEHDSIQPSGINNGLDYMIYHNLYYLLYGDYLPDFSEDFSCNCEQEVQLQPSVPPSDQGQVNRLNVLNKKLESVYWCPPDAFEGTFNYIDANYQVNPQFLDYVDLGIPTHEFQLAHTTITENGSVDVNSNLVICDGKALTIEGSTGSKGNLTTNWANVLVRNGGSIDNSGEIIIRDGTAIHIKEGAKLILRNGSELRIKEGGQLIIDGTLEYYDGASIITEYDNAEIVLNGTIKMMDGGVFTCGNTPGQPTGRLVINNSNAKFSKAIGAGFCEVKLAGQDENDEFVVIKKDVALKVMHLMPTNIDRLFVHSSKVVFEENAFMDVRQEFITSNARYVSNKMNRGIRVTNFNKFASVDLENVNIHADLNAVFGEKLSMITCTMTNTPGITDPTEPMVDVQGTGFGVNYCIFEGDNEAYIYAENLTFPSVVTNSTFNGLAETSATAIEDRSNTELTVTENTFNNMYNGVWKLYDPVKVRCNTFNNSTRNDVGAVLGSTANLSSDDFGGYNDFNSEDASYGHIWLWEGDVELNNGGNYFNPAIQKHIYARMPYPCPYGLYCYIAANRNQWNTGTQVPSASKFDVVGSDLSPIAVDASSPTMQPTCGSWDTSPPVGSGILPNISTSLGDLPLDKTIFFARSEMTINDTLANDEDALKLFDEIFSANVSLDSANTRRLMYNALSDMKSSLEAEYYTQVVLQESGQNPIMDYVGQYLSALNYMTPSSITAENYRQAFHLELDKAQLYRMLEMPEAALEILEFTEACGLDSLEQEALNYWKEQVELDIVIDSMGLDFLDSNIIIDTKGYNTPTSNPAAIYHFGTHFNTLYDRSYASCSGEERLMGGQEDQELVNLGVYPVPADEVINITIEVEDGIVLSSIQLFDAMGRKMGEIELQPDQTEVRNYSIRNWASGVYYYNASGPSGSFGGGTFVVE